MTYNALAVANYFLDKAKAESKPLTPMKLQKLIYFAHGWNLALYGGEPLIDEEVQAWDYGPVVTSVYHEFKNFGGNRIDRMATDFDMDEMEIVTPRISLDEKRPIALMDKVWDIYSQYTGIQLSNLTHEPGSAWSEVREKADKTRMRSIGIPNERIKDEFERKRKK